MAEERSCVADGSYGYGLAFSLRGTAAALESIDEVLILIDN